MMTERELMYQISELFSGLGWDVMAEVRLNDGPRRYALDLVLYDNEKPVGAVEIKRRHTNGNEMQMSRILQSVAKYRLVDNLEFLVLFLNEDAYIYSNNKFIQLKEIPAPDNYKRIIAESLIASGTDEGYKQALDMLLNLTKEYEKQAIARQESSPKARSPKVFISYSSKEHQEACDLRKLLQDNGVTCWMAPESITPGKDYGAEINQALKAVDALVLILSTASQDSPWVLREVDRAISFGKVVVPIHIDESELTDSFEFRLGIIHRIEAFERVTEALESVITSLKALVLEDDPAF